MATLTDHGHGNMQPVCQNCQTSTTPLWRRDEMGSVLCNACGLFLKLHGTPRPISLKTDVIKSRNRVKTAGQGQKRKVSYPRLRTLTLLMFDVSLCSTAMASQHLIQEWMAPLQTTYKIDESPTKHLRVDPIARTRPSQEPTHPPLTTPISPRSTCSTGYHSPIMPSSHQLYLNFVSLHRGPPPPLTTATSNLHRRTTLCTMRTVR